MVAKQRRKRKGKTRCLNLAKIHMVAKLYKLGFFFYVRLNLAKIHMVAKP